jgi:hypothetical protein
MAALLLIAGVLAVVVAVTNLPHLDTPPIQALPVALVLAPPVDRSAAQIALGGRRRTGKAVARPVTLVVLLCFK